jgi:hypothetical protein
VESTRRRRAERGLACAAAALGLATIVACGNGASPPGGTGGGAAADVGTVVAGVTTNLRVGTDIDHVHAVMRGGGQVLRDEVLPAGADKLAFPFELAFAGRPAGELIELELTGTSSAVQGLRVDRKASTNVVGGQALLLRVALDSQCVAVDQPGGPKPPICGATQTCIAGSCGNVHVDPSALEPYAPAWSNEAPPDRCRPAHAGPPEVVVGQGQSDFLPLDDCSAPSPVPAQVETGPQGGHHIWLAVRMKNLHQSGSITTVRGHFRDFPTDPSDMAVIFTFDPDEGGYCKLYGIRYQLDTNGVAIQQVLGKTIDVSIEVKDADGTTGVGKRCVVLSKDLI